MNKARMLAAALVALSFLASLAGVAVQSARLAAEKTSHAATVTAYEAKLERAETRLAMAEASLKTAGAGIAALQEQARTANARADEERNRAAARADVMAKVTPVPPVSVDGPGVVDTETSRRAVDHINLALGYAL